MLHALIYIGVVFVIFVLEFIFVAIWTLIYYKLDVYDFDEALSKGLIFILLLFTLLFSKYLTDEIIENNNVIISETVSENGGE